MIIKKLILKGYKRLFLNRINILEYEPDKPMQIILGRNMSGKSQTLKQLNPLPANLKQEFYEDGYKYIEIEHNNKKYILSSGYIGNNKHSFKIEDKELNNGGTKKVQLDLIKEHFGITTEIMEILLNNNRLTTMSIVDRKKWLSELSTVDYTFSIGVYNKLRSKHRDILGGIKLTQENIIKYKNNIMPEEQLEKLKEDKKILEEYYKHIVSLYEHNNTSTNDTLDNLKILNRELKELLSKNISGNIEELKIEKEKLIAEYKSKQDFINKTTELISKIEKTPEIEDIKRLKERLSEIENQLTEIYKNKKMELDDMKCSDYYIKYNKLHLVIIGYINTLTMLDNVRLMPKEEQDKIIELNNKLNNHISILNKRLELIKTEIEHLNKHKTQEHLIKCPKCKHTWYNGFNLDNYTNLKKQEEELNNKIKAYTDLYNKNKLSKDKIEEKNLNVDLFIKVFQENYDLKEVWDNILIKFDINTSTSSELVSLFNSLNKELYELKDLSNLLKEKERIETIFKNYEDSKKLELKDKKEQIEKLTKLLETTTIEKNKLKNEIEENNNKFNILNNISILHNQVKTILKENREKLNNDVIKLRNSLLTELSEFIKEEVVKIEQTMNQQLQNNIKLEKDKKTLEEYKLQEKVLGCMVKELSPTEGLIAISINSFLNIFVQEMNDVLDKIWSYPLELLPCEANEENDLDYKFRVRINNDEVIEDVSKLSSSGKEIIDLAFRIVFAKYMHLNEVPLYLDEFGSSFDSKNISNAYYVIETLANIDYPQIFIISHFEHVYGSINNADFNILDSNNIGMETLQNKKSCLTLS